MSIYVDRSTKSQGHTIPLLESSFHCPLYRLAVTAMEAERSCQCSLGALQVMAELRNVHTVAELDTILDLVQSIYNQGQVILKCKECRKNSGSLVSLPSLVDQCLTLFEAACLAYNVARKNNLFDPAVLAFEQPLPQFICIRSKMQLGQMDLDEDETRMLVRILLGKNLMKLLELLNTARSISQDSGQPHRIGVGAMRALNSSVESTIHRIVVFMDQIDVE